MSSSDCINSLKRITCQQSKCFRHRLNPHGETFKHQVFYCLTSDLSDQKAFVLPAGNYASIYYTGTYKNRGAALRQLNDYLKQHQLATIGDYYEFYLIDFHETNQPTEYVSKIEILLDQP